MMAGRYLFLNGFGRREDLVMEHRQSPLLFYNDEDFLREFRMTKPEVNYLSGLLKDELYSRGRRNIDLSVEDKVLISLKTLASGSFQNTSKDFLNVSQPTVSKVLSCFTDSMVRKASQFIYMPRNDAELAKSKGIFTKSQVFLEL